MAVGIVFFLMKACLSAFLFVAWNAGVLIGVVIIDSFKVAVNKAANEVAKKQNLKKQGWEKQRLYKKKPSSNEHVNHVK